MAEQRPLSVQNPARRAAGFLDTVAEESVFPSGLARFVTTRGGAYCFLPSISGIRYRADRGQLASFLGCDAQTGHDTALDRTGMFYRDARAAG
jgi:hypothetical protein